MNIPLSSGARTAEQRIRHQVRQRRCTLLGVGVVSQTTVDVTIELANRHAVDLMLIASRSQVDMDAAGGGYVCGWNASRLADYVRLHDHDGHILLCRDHGGPWQNSRELAKRLTPAEAMGAAKQSYLEDIEAGFQVLHLDPSVSPDGPPSQAEALSRLKDLYRFCVDAADRAGRPIAFEVGTEEQDDCAHSVTQLLAMLEDVMAFCGREKLPRPTFVVAQTGTKVMETGNVGQLESYLSGEGGKRPISDLIARLGRLGVFLKQHNTDYLPQALLAEHPMLGVQAANVAPEFGVTETRALIEALEDAGLRSYRDRFLELALRSGKWSKWMLPGTTATDRDRAEIAGHYVFSQPEFIELKAAMGRDLQARGVDLQAILHAKVRAAVERYMAAFRLRETP
jgi:hypothetical protein